MRLTLRDALGAVFILAMCAMCVRLGFWQLDRLEQRRARNAVVLAGMRQAPRPIDAALVSEMRRDPARLAYRRVVARGRYLAAAEVVLRGRVEGGRPGVHLATPLLLDDGSILLVNRGWVPAADAVRPAERPAPPAGAVTVEGILQEVPITQDRGGRSISARGDTAYRRLDRGEARARLGSSVLPMYLQLLGDTAGAARSLPVAVPPPPLDEGPHLGYAIQWFSFALIGVVGLFVLLRRRGAAPS
ncbi:MAG TPA: SURF1 family protein [Longimicrobium sp.]|jgi:surfeit locus 1 family protein